MLEVTGRAEKEIAKFFGNHEISRVVRVYLHEGGCAGSVLALVMDEQRDADAVFEHNGIAYVVDRELLHQTGAITIDFVEDGYPRMVVTSEHIQPATS
jgi:Fe-S cluster assembly iron-binding protein IscA